VREAVDELPALFFKNYKAFLQFFATWHSSLEKWQYVIISYGNS